jgi:L-2-hydroxyglutarate oxidase
VLVLDKEGVISGHQSGRNSGVIHAGVYYSAGSHKARLCTAGRASMVAFCRDQGIPHHVCGKVVVAVDETERDRLSDLQSRCRANGVRVEAIDREELHKLEPYVAGVAGLHVPDTGVLNYADVCEAYARDIRQAGGTIRLETTVLRGTERAEGLVLETTRDPIAAQRVVACCGLHADEVARCISGPGADGGLRIIPFRGEYYELAPARSHLVRALIYPVPDPQFPFLGVHLSRGIDDKVHLGPNAVLALAREGYSWRHIDMTDLLGTVRWPGFRLLARKHWRYALGEMTRSLSRRRFTRALQRLVPEITETDLEPAPAGVRAQAVGADGSLVDDFAFRQLGRAFHVLNAPSPAATASLEIGAMISQRLELAT